MWRIMFKDHFGCSRVKTISTWRTSETKWRGEKREPKSIYNERFAAYVKTREREKQQLNGFFADVKYLISRTDFPSYGIHLDVCSLPTQFPLLQNCQCLRWWNVVKNKWWGRTSSKRFILTEKGWKIVKDGEKGEFNAFVTEQLRSCYSFQSWLF